MTEVFLKDRRDGNSRKNDPITSVQAGEEVVRTGTAASHRQLILSTLRDSEKPLTNMEIMHKAGLQFREQVSRRMKELERKGLAVRSRNTICPYLNRNVGTWKASEVKESPSEISEHDNMILDVLNEISFPLTDMQIAKASGLNRNEVINSLIKLKKDGFVEQKGFVNCPMLKTMSPSWGLKK